jgi:hypothetical protein
VSERGQTIERSFLRCPSATYKIFKAISKILVSFAVFKR